VGALALLQFIKAGKLRCIATGTPTRLPQLTDVPTVAEQARWKPVIARAQIKPEGA
jgi:tripartite-type tricarboxylate transporter receptor subunit TctC